jgi:cytochrome P450
VDLPEGAKLFLWLAASGRDASVFPEPETFNLRRSDMSKSLAFGFGIHYCLGAALAKLKARLALEGPSLFLDFDWVDGQELSFHPNISFRGPQSLVGQGPNLMARTGRRS